MSMFSKLIKSKFGFFVAFLAGFLVLMVVAKNKKPLPMEAVSERAILVETVTLKERMIGSQIVAFGHVRPQKEWQAISEIEGRITYKNPMLERGKFIEQGTILLKVDPLQYELQVAQATADLASVKSELDSLVIEKNNLQLSLEIEKNQLKIVDNEVKRQERLLKKKLTSQSSYDAERRNLLSQRQRVLDLENTLRLVPSRKLVLEASHRVQTARLADAQRLLEKTVVTMPFRGLIVEENINVDEVVSVSKIMVVAHAWEQMEVESQVGIHDMRKAMRTLPKEVLVSLEKVEPSYIFPSAEVVVRAAGEEIRWPASLNRISGEVDQSRGTVGLIVEVRQDPNAIKIRQRPPLVAGMFVEVRVTGREDRLLALPARAIHQGNVYIVDQDSRLRIKPVKELFSSNGWVAIEKTEELSGGEQIILTDLVPVIAGALVKTQPVDEGSMETSPSSTIQPAVKKTSAIEEG